MKKGFDLLIIGCGSAELSASWFARQLDLSVAIVEKGRLGGDCTWIGGIPSKTLLRAAKSAPTIRNAARSGVIAPEPAIDFKSVMGLVNSVVQKIFEAELSDALRSEGIEVDQDEARFVSPQAVAVDGREISARRFLFCTGAGQVIPPIDGLSEVDYLTSEAVWDLEELPPRLAGVEGGPIGCGLTQAFWQFGSSVTLVEAAERIMLQDEPEAADVIAQRLVQDGVDLRTSATLQRVEKTATGIRLVLGGGGEVEAGAVLVSVGRRPQVEGLELEQAKVNHGPGGTQVNKKLRTSQPNIFAAGDCTDGYQFTHYAGYQGFTAVRDAFLPSRKKSILHHPGQGEPGTRHGPRKSPDFNYENDDEASQERSATEGTNHNCIALDSLEDGYWVNWGAGCVVQA